MCLIHHHTEAHNDLVVPEPGIWLFYFIHIPSFIRFWQPVCLPSGSFISLVVDTYIRDNLPVSCCLLLNSGSFCCMEHWSADCGLGESIERVAEGWIRMTTIFFTTVTNLND